MLSRRPTFGRWIVAALAVHGLLFWVWRAERSAEVRRPDVPAETVDTADTMRTSDLIELDLRYEERSPGQQVAAPRGDAHVNAEAGGGSVSPLPAPRDRNVPTATESVRLAGSPDETTAVPGGSAPEAHLSPSPAPSGSAPTPAPPQSLALQGASTQTPTRLEALGIGKPNAAALQPYLTPQPLALAQDRLDQNLAQAILDADRDHSVGIEGPITNALHTGAMSTIEPRSLSKVAIIIGSDGKLVDFRILQTNRNARGLHALGERVKHLLANQKVRVPPGRAVEFIYELKSEVLLPSGRAPGLGVEVLGVPLKKAEEKSSKISILTPIVKFEPLVEPDPDRNGKVTQTLPQLSAGISVLGLDADPVDIAATARQVVHTRLLQQRVL